MWPRMFRAPQDLKETSKTSSLSLSVGAGPLQDWPTPTPTEAVARHLRRRQSVRLPSHPLPTINSASPNLFIDPPSTKAAVVKTLSGAPQPPGRLAKVSSSSLLRPIAVPRLSPPIPLLPVHGGPPTPPCWTRSRSSPPLAWSCGPGRMRPSTRPSSTASSPTPLSRRSVAPAQSRTCSRRPRILHTRGTSTRSSGPL